MPMGRPKNTTAGFASRPPAVRRFRSPFFVWIAIFVVPGVNRVSAGAGSGDDLSPFIRRAVRRQGRVQVRSASSLPQ